MIAGHDLIQRRREMVIRRPLYGADSALRRKDSPRFRAMISTPIGKWIRNGNALCAIASALPPATIT